MQKVDQTLTRQPKRRFLELKVDEVSLVDLPANEKDFVVVKSQAAQEENMSGKTETENNPERVAVEVPDSNDPAVAKALEHVASIVDSITKSFTQPAAPAVAGTTETDAEKAKGKKNTGYSMREMAKMLLGPKATQADIDKHLETLAKAGIDLDAPAPVAKAAEPPAPVPAPASAMPTRDELLGDFLSTISKAKSFTPERIDALKKMAEMLKAMLEEVAPGASPATSAPKLVTSPGSGIQDLMAQKSADPVVKAIQDLATEISKRIGAVESEVAAIKNATPAPSGSEPAGTATETKKNQGLWSGVL